jgi:hypothetical protein
MMVCAVAIVVVQNNNATVKFSLVGIPQNYNKEEAGVNRIWKFQITPANLSRISTESCCKEACLNALNTHF